MNKEIAFSKLPPVPVLPLDIDPGEWTEGHVQGIALDTDQQYMYFSFTTVLVKTDLKGKVIGTVSGLTGHLGCISFNGGDRKVYGSIEYKHDSIGKSIMARTGRALADEDAFYMGIFDVDKIDRVGMDAETDGIMKAVYLPDVAQDFSAEGLDGKPHRYACSGIDGTGFGPEFGAPQVSQYMLYVAYGVYGDNDRRDNDHQVILQFDWRHMDAVAKPLCQNAPHHSGIRADKKYFLYTGNTTWGIQNLEYDRYLDAWIVSVYRGKKESFRNPPMYLIDRTAAPVRGNLKGLDGEEGELLALLPIGTPDEANGVWGCDFPKGQTGIYSFGNGYYYISFEGRTPAPEKKHTCHVKLCRFNKDNPELFEIIEQY
ncbi:MAG: hypothetical protein MJ102_06880 [Clostridia bacterium]|nr:hypothetical protein [Clostridia bacterium]